MASMRVAIPIPLKPRELTVDREASCRGAIATFGSVGMALETQRVIRMLATILEGTIVESMRKLCLEGRGSSVVGEYWKPPSIAILNALYIFTIAIARNRGDSNIP